MNRYIFFTLSLTLLFVSLGVGAQAKAKPSRIIELLQVTVLPGRDALFEDVQEQYARFFRELPLPGYTIALLPLEMPDPWEDWFYTGYDSYAQREQYDKIVAAHPAIAAKLNRLEASLYQVEAAQKSVLAYYRPDWSYMPDLAASVLLGARYLRITLLEVRLGYDDEFAQLMADELQGYVNARWPQPRITYAVTDGGQNARYVFVEPMNSLSALDSLESATNKFKTVVGDARWKEIASLRREVVTSTKAWLLQVNPATSNVSNDFIKTDSNYWKPKF